MVGKNYEFWKNFRRTRIRRIVDLMRNAGAPKPSLVAHRFGRSITFTTKKKWAQKDNFWLKYGLGGIANQGKNRTHRQKSEPKPVGSLMSFVKICIFQKKFWHHMDSIQGPLALEFEIRRITHYKYKQTRCAPHKAKTIGVHM